jgi:tetratricopeptide (TPR) repeat protein
LGIVVHGTCAAVVLFSIERFIGRGSMQDSLGNTVTTGCGEALRLIDSAIDLHARGWPGALEAAEAAATEDPELAIAHALQAVIHGMWGRRDQAEAAMSRALQFERHTSARERSLIELLDYVLGGRTQAGLAWLLAHLRRFPSDMLALTTGVGAYGLFAFSGRSDHNEQRLLLLDELERHYPLDDPWLLAYRGWVRIELGGVDEGLAMALRAIESNPQNAHNAHIVAHGLHEANRPTDYLAFLPSWLAGYPRDGLMWGHLEWHAAIAELALGDEEAAIHRCLDVIVPHLARGAPFMGLADGSSLLWRLGLQSVSALPWNEVARHASRHFPNGSNAFGELHLAMVAAALRDRDSLARCSRRLESLDSGGNLGARAAQSWVAGLRSLMDGDQDSGVQRLIECEEEAARLGGSNAQRSIIAHTRQAGRIPPAQPH